MLKAALAPVCSSLGAALRNARYRIRHSSNGVVIGHHAELYDVHFGRHVNIAHHAQVTSCSLGDRTSIGRYSKLRGADIGKYCSISWDVTIGALSHPMDHPSSHAFWYRKQFGLCTEDKELTHERIEISNDVWIGCHAVLMPGLHIGNGAVIGAGSVVTKDIEPYMVVAGVPAKPIKMRFDTWQVSQLEKLQWWNWSDEKIRENIPGFFSKPYCVDGVRIG